MVQDIRRADSVPQAIKILGDRLSSVERRRKPLALIRYSGTPLAPFNAASTLSASTAYTVSTVTIADPGYPYTLEAAGGFFLQALAGTNPGVSHSLCVRVDTTTPVGPAAAPDAATLGAQFIGAIGTFSNPNFRRRGSTVYTGQHTVSLLLQMGGAGTAQTPASYATRSDYYFDVIVHPASA